MPVLFLPANLSFKIDGDYDKFKNIKIDGNVIDKKNYTAEKGSTIITLKPEYLKNLALGKHDLQVLFDGKEVNVNFTVTDTSSPKTTAIADMKAICVRICQAVYIRPIRPAGWHISASLKKKRNSLSYCLCATVPAKKIKMKKK